MAKLKPFRGIRPPKDLAPKIASRPYDVLNSEEAREEAKGNEYSLLHIIKAEIDFASGTDVHSKEVYDKAVANYKSFLEKKWLAKDKKECLYIYAQTMNNHTQYGLVGCASVQDYLSGKIKKHELTRPDKEEDRMKHVRNTNANIEPVFFTYPEVPEIDSIIQSYVESNDPVFDFTAEDGVGHHFWVVDNEKVIEDLVRHFEEVPATYIADGHHRTAAAALVGNEKKLANPNHRGDEEYNFFLAVHFPGNQLNIIDYNRVVKDLNSHSTNDFIQALNEDFDIQECGREIYKPEALHTFGMYIDNSWYKLTAKSHTYDNSDPIGVLDVTVLSKFILEKLLDIKNLRTDKRIDFVGGIRGLEKLEKRVDSGEMKVAFALYPVTMKQLFDIADNDMIMPPKTTWFEPKLRSGLVIHDLEE
jgi:uncharacterized protein (DUF1015 family)